MAPYDGECRTWDLANTYGTMPSWNTSLVTDMSGCRSGSCQQVNAETGMFFKKYTFNGDISKWDTSGVKNMRYMFYSASRFNQDIGSWNTSQVTNMETMFRGAFTFNHDISSWTGPAATTVQTEIFSYATAFLGTYTCTTTVNGPVSSCVPR